MVGLKCNVDGVLDLCGVVEFVVSGVRSGGGCGFGRAVLFGGIELDEFVDEVIFLIVI